ncbi:MAG: hypothetical protein ACE5I8_07275 [Thermodesulfobacteriota bacterium]
MKVRRLFIFPTLIILVLGTFSLSQDNICIVKWVIDGRESV